MDTVGYTKPWPPGPYNTCSTSWYNGGLSSIREYVACITISQRPECAERPWTTDGCCPPYTVWTSDAVHCFTPFDQSGRRAMVTQRLPMAYNVVQRSIMTKPYRTVQEQRSWRPKPVGPSIANAAVHRCGSVTIRLFVSKLHATHACLPYVPPTAARRTEVGRWSIRSTLSITVRSVPETWAVRAASDRSYTVVNRVNPDSSVPIGK